MGQRKSVARSSTAFSGPKTIAWDYDSLGQVTLADVNGMGDRAYEYDAIGNRKKSAHNTLTLPATDNHTSNALNQYTTVPGHTGAIVHDPDGNLTQGSTAATSNLVWDGENRLISATNSSSGQTTTYRYDAFSRRISRSVGVSPTTLFIYDAWNCITEYQFHHSSFNLHTSYLWGMDLSGTMQGAGLAAKASATAGGVGGLLSQRTTFNSPAVFYYPCYDGNGNVTQYLTSTGTIATSFEYDPFGRLMINTITNLYLPYRFSTKPLDQATGLYYYGYRYYDPNTGRWPSRDPIEENGGINLYGFVENSGINVIDVLGLQNFNCDPCEEQCPPCDEADPGARGECLRDCNNAKLGMKCGPGGDDGEGVEEDSDLSTYIQIVAGATIAGATAGAATGLVTGGSIGTIGGPAGSGMGALAGGIIGGLGGSVAGATAGLLYVFLGWD